MTTMITAEQAARALVRAARKWGVDPLKVFEAGNEGVRIEAAFNWYPCPPSRTELLARIFQLPNPVCEPAGASA